MFSVWCAYLQQIVKAMAEGKIPDIHDAVESISLIENPKAVKKAMDIYKRSMGNLILPTKDVNTFNAHHKKAEAAAVEDFKKNRFRDSNGQYQQQLKVTNHFSGGSRCFFGQRQSGVSSSAGEEVPDQNKEGLLEMLIHNFCCIILKWEEGAALLDPCVFVFLACMERTTPENK